MLPCGFVIHDMPATRSTAPVRSSAYPVSAAAAPAVTFTRCSTPAPSKSMRVSDAAGPPQRRTPVGDHCQPSSGTLAATGAHAGLRSRAHQPKESTPHDASKVPKSDAGLKPGCMTKTMLTETKGAAIVATAVCHDELHAVVHETL